MSEPTQPTCRTCVHFDDREDVPGFDGPNFHGSCRRYPPTGEGRRPSPPVRHDDHCGEHQNFPAFAARLLARRARTRSEPHTVSEPSAEADPGATLPRSNVVRAVDAASAPEAPEAGETPSPSRPPGGRKKIKNHG